MSDLVGNPKDQLILDSSVNILSNFDFKNKKLEWLSVQSSSTLAVVPAKLISAFVFTAQTVQSSSSLIRNFKLLAISCSCTDRFVSDLVRNPKTGFLALWLICESMVYVCNMILLVCFWIFLQIEEKCKIFWLHFRVIHHLMLWLGMGTTLLINTT